MKRDKDIATLSRDKKTSRNDKDARMILFKGKTNDLETLFPPTLKLDGQICVRNGISARSKFMIGIYDIALYLGKMTEDAETAITARYAKQLRMVSRRNIKGSLLENAFKDGIRANSSAEEYQKIASVIDDVFGELFKTNTIKEGAMFTIEFSPEHGVRLNYDEVGDLPYIKEEGFDQAILRAWLGDNPISLEMKKDLLGQH